MKELTKNEKPTDHRGATHLHPRVIFELLTNSWQLMQVRYAAQNDLDPEHANQIAEWTRKFGDVPDRAPVVALSEIEAEDWTLLQGEGWLDD